MLRVDPLTGRRVYIAENRAGRPNEFAGAAFDPPDAVSEHPYCPFCPGNEHQTPHTLREVCDETGQCQIRVVPNKFPAIDPVEEYGQAELPPAAGAQEVIIESRRHLERLSDLSPRQWNALLQVYVERLRYWSQDARLPYRLLFKNIGASGGASLRHLHSQLLVLPQLPPYAQVEADSLQSYYAAHGCCGWCSRLADERNLQRRIVRSSDHLIAFCPATARQPFETWIMPTRHAADFTTVLGLDGSGAFIHEVVCRVEQVIGAAGYNLLIHTCPLNVNPREFHWRIEILPRIASLAGLELATGLYINSLSPEHAAEELRRDEQPSGSAPSDARG